MIESVEVHNFKCFQHLEVPRLSRITIVGGRNAVGKTALLECLFMFFDRLSPNTTTGQYARRGVSSVPLTPADVFAPIFPFYDLTEPIEVSVRVRGVIEQMRIAFNPSYGAPSVAAEHAATGNGVMVLPTDSPAKPVVSLDMSYRSSRTREDETHLLLRPNELSLAVEKVITDLPSTALLSTGPSDPNQVAALYGQMDVAGTHERVLPILQVLKPELRLLSSVQMGNRALMHADIGIGRKLPVPFISEGLTRLLTIAVFLGTCPGGTVFVDEIENGIHHSAMAGVWKALGAAAREFDCQLVATTHSYECLEAAAEGLSGDFRDDLSYVRLERRNDQTIARVYDRCLLDTALANGLELR